MTDPSPRPRLKPARSMHGHMWLMGFVGVAAGLVLLIYVPGLTVISKSILFFAGFHLVGAVVLVASLAMGPARGLGPLLRRWTGAEARAKKDARFDFGWGPGWMNGLAIAALISAAAAVAVEVAAPRLWLLGFGLVALATSFLAGNVIMRGFRRPDHMVLPLVDLALSEADVVLDAGCGAGRTSIALARVVKGVRIVGVDRFDAGYIDGGGRALLARNLRLAGLSDRVSAETADLTALPFPDGAFDGAVSAHVYDHLGAAKGQGLRELIRVLKPGGRFLMIVWTPGWSMFAVANVLSFFLTSKQRWRGLAEGAGFRRLDEGVFNNAWFILLEKPGGAAT